MGALKKLFREIVDSYILLEKARGGRLFHGSLRKFVH